MKKIVLFLYILVSLKSGAQTVEILYKSTIENLTASSAFEYLSSTTDTTFVECVAIIQAKGKNKKATIENMYAKIRDQANELGANSFKAKSFVRDEIKNEATLILYCYYASNQVLNFNNGYHKKNVVYVFGREKENDGRTISVGINDRYFDIKPGMYLTQTLEEGRFTKISRGGLVSATELIKWEDDRPPIFYTLTGLGIRTYQNMSGRVGTESDTIYIKGEIDRIRDISFGLLLKDLLKKIN